MERKVALPLVVFSRHTPGRPRQGTLLDQSDSDHSETSTVYSQDEKAHLMKARELIRQVEV